MNKLCCLIGMFSTCGFCEAQNLVPNPSFEDTVSCPIGGYEVDKCVGWSSYSGSSDYMNSCSTGSVSVPNNWAGYQPAATGNAYCAIVTYVSAIPNYREHIGRMLSNPLSIGIKYFVSLKIALSIDSIFESNCATNKMGIMFSTIPYDVSHPSPITNNPQVHSDSIITDTLNWTLISGSFIADSAYNYIIIGNFFNDNLTDTIRMANGSLDDAYYFIDDVCVSTDSLTCNATVGINEVKNTDDFVLFPNPFTDKINITTKRNELVEVNFFDVTARKIFNQSFINSTSINTEQLAKGLYLYEVRNKNGVIKKGKIVKD
jgi:hypothetical protein